MPAIAAIIVGVCVVTVGLWLAYPPAAIIFAGLAVLSAGLLLVDIGPSDRKERTR